MPSRLSQEASQALVLAYGRAAPGRTVTDADMLDALGRCRVGAASAVVASTVVADAGPVELALAATVSAPPPRLSIELRTTFHRAELLRREANQPLLTTGHLLLALVDSHAPTAEVDSAWARLARTIDRSHLLEQQETPARGERRIIRARLSPAVAEVPEHATPVRREGRSL